MKTKVLIQVNGGNVTIVASNQDIDIVIVDLDNIDVGSNPISKNKPDRIVENFYELYNPNDNYEADIYYDLKSMKL